MRRLKFSPKVLGSAQNRSLEFDAGESRENVRGTRLNTGVDNGCGWGAGKLGNAHGMGGGARLGSIMFQCEG